MKKPRTSRQYHVQFTWFGHSAFLLESADGSSVLIDPWLDNPRAPAGTKDNVSPGLILISHGHSDHLGNAVEVANRSDAHVVAIHEVALYLTSKGIRNVTGINKGGTVSIAGVSVSMTDAKHSSSIDAEDPPIPGGDPAGFVVRFSDGFAVYHAGDTCLFGDMRYRLPSRPNC
jgi:L-ascorbate metabolism protein UlaG (beta-lactamase superfamily)